MFPSEKALKTGRAAIREKTGASRSYQPVKKLIEELNKHLSGWQNYFSQGYPVKAYGQMNWYVRFRLVRHLRRRSQRPYKKPEDVSWFRHLEELGLLLLQPKGSRN